MNIKCAGALFLSQLAQSLRQLFFKQMSHLRDMVSIRGRAVAQRRARASRGTRGPGSTPGCPLSSSFFISLFLAVCTRSPDVKLFTLVAHLSMVAIGCAWQ